MEDNIKFFKVKGTNFKLQEKFEWLAQWAGWLA